jgi:hypothetical protein
MQTTTPQQATAIVQLHHWANECVKQNLNPVVLLSVNQIDGKMNVLAHVPSGIDPEEVLILLKNAYEGMKQQINVTPSGIIKSINGNG